MTKQEHEMLLKTLQTSSDKIDDLFEITAEEQTKHSLHKFTISIQPCTDNENTNNLQQSKRNRRGKCTINILGDSMVKDIRHWGLQQLIPNFKVFAKTFAGATTQDMANYVEPSMNHEPDIIFCH